MYHKISNSFMSPTVKLVAVDDTASSLDLVAESLHQDGLAIFTSTDPEEGLDLVYREHPQIVLLDLMMPKMSGIEMLERIIAFDPAIDVILMTAHYASDTAVEAIQKGACDYLNKPISIPALRERVGRLLAEAGQRRCNKEIHGLTRRAQIVLSRHSWPGNIRELENVLGHAAMMTLSDTLDVQDLPLSVRGPEASMAESESAFAPNSSISFEDHERQLLTDALAQAGGNQSEAARILRISRDRIRYKMAKYNLH